MIGSVAVYLGSAEASEKYRKFAFDFGVLMASMGIRVVYGGAAVGTMQTLADGVLSAGGNIVGVIPEHFGGKREVAATHRNIHRDDLTENILVKDMAERKAVMTRLSDCCAILPGSCGTMDELFCYAMENEIGLHDKPAFVLNVDGYYDGLEMQVKRFKAEGFLHPSSKVITFVHSIDEFENILKNL